MAERIGASGAFTVDGAATVLAEFYRWKASVVDARLIFYPPAHLAHYSRNWGPACDEHTLKLLESTDAVWATERDAAADDLRRRISREQPGAQAFDRTADELAAGRTVRVSVRDLLFALGLRAGFEPPVRRDDLFSVGAPDELLDLFWLPPVDGRWLEVVVCGDGVTPE